MLIFFFKDFGLMILNLFLYKGIFFFFFFGFLVGLILFLFFWLFLEFRVIVFVFFFLNCFIRIGLGGGRIG